MPPPADPDTLKQMTEAAQRAAEGGGDVSGYWPGIGAAVGAAYLFVSRKMGAGRVVDAIREEATATRSTLHAEGERTRDALAEVKAAMAHVSGQLEGYHKR